MTSLRKVIIGTGMGASSQALSTPGASAVIVCSGNVCWHAQGSYDYPPTAHVIVHEETGHAGPGITLREYEGRGYWSGDRWTEW